MGTGRTPRIIAAFNTTTGRGRDLMRGVSAFAMQHGHWHCEFTNDDPAEGTIRSARQADGLLIHLNNLSIARMASRLKIPVVVLGSYNPLDAPNVTMDVEAIGNLAAAHLVEQGFRRFAYYAHFATPNSMLMGNAFTRAIEKGGYTCEWFQVEEGRSRLLGPNHAKVVRWIKRINKPVAIFTIGDTVARALSEACRDAKVGVPQEVAILGVNNDSLVCKMCRPYLSSIETGAERIGFEGARMLHRLIEGSAAEAKRVLFRPLRVIVRESTDFVIAGDSRVTAAMEYIRVHLSEGVNVKQLTRHLEVCRTTLDTLFQAQLGRSAHDQIVRMQLQRACRLLEEQKLSLEQIAMSCGMHYRTRLGNFFKKHMGITPLEYRRAHQRPS